MIYVFIGAAIKKPVRTVILLSPRCRIVRLLGRPRSLRGLFLRLAYDRSVIHFFVFFHLCCQHKHLCVFPCTSATQFVFSYFFFQVIFLIRPVFSIFFLIRGFETVGIAVVRWKGGRIDGRGDGWTEEADGSKHTHQISRTDGGFARAKNTALTKFRPYTWYSKKLKLRKGNEI